MTEQPVEGQDVSRRDFFRWLAGFVLAALAGRLVVAEQETMQEVEVIDETEFQIELRLDLLDAVVKELVANHEGLQVKVWEQLRSIRFVEGELEDANEGYELRNRDLVVYIGNYEPSVCVRPEECEYKHALMEAKLNIAVLDAVVMLISGGEQEHLGFEYYLGHLPRYPDSLQPDRKELDPEWDMLTRHAQGVDRPDTRTGDPIWFLKVGRQFVPDMSPFQRQA